MSSAHPAPMPVVILISGQGSNMLAIAEAARAGKIPVEVTAVISNRAAAAGLSAAGGLGIETRIVAPDQYPDRLTYDLALAAAINAYAPRVVVLAGFMRILTAAFVHEFSGRLLNIHPSLLPAYRGL